MFSFKNLDSKQRNMVIISVVSFVSVILIAFIVVVSIYFVQKNNHTNQVKDGLVAAVDSIEKHRIESGAYPVEILDLIDSSKIKDVELSGQGSFDGTSFCISGKSVKDNKVSYYIDSKSNKEPVEGVCEAAAQKTAPSFPGGLAVAFASSNSIKITWNESLYASEYTLQCSDDDSFINPISVTTSELSGQCDNLKSKRMYYYRVKATNGVGDSDWTIAQQMSTL
jgi:hypothetical protein